MRTTPILFDPKFGTLHLSLPVEDGEAANAIVKFVQNGLPRTSTVNTSNQTIPLRFQQSATHTYDPTEPFTPDKVKGSIKAEYIPVTRRLAFTIEESKLPLEFLQALLTKIIFTTHTPLTREPHFALYTITKVAEPMIEAYATLIDYLGEFIYQRQQRKPGLHAQLLEDINAEPPRGKAPEREVGMLPDETYNLWTFTKDESDKQ